MMYDELYNMTDERLLQKIDKYLSEIKNDVAFDNIGKEELIKKLEKIEFYVKFHLEVNKKNDLDDYGEELKKIRDNREI